MAELLRVSHADYQHDRLPGSPRFSRSTALILLDDSPAQAKHEHPALGGHPPNRFSEASTTGSLVHSLLLESGPEIVLVRVHANKERIGPVVDALDFKKAEAQEIKRDALARGALPVLPGQWESVSGAAEEIRKRVIDLGVVLPGPSHVIGEGTFLWNEGGVACKTRPDITLAGVKSANVWDLKVTGCPAFGGHSAKPAKNPAAFRAGMVRYGYDIQAYFAGAALAALNPDLAGWVDFNFVVCKAVPPFDCWLQPVGESMLAFGNDRSARARGIWARCLASGEWPGIGEQPPAEVKPWDQEQELVARLAAMTEPEWVTKDPE